MTDQDELRDKIAEVIDVHDEQFFDGDYKTTLAQAIIDSLGLTVEQSVIQDALVDFGERAMKMQLDQLRTDEAHAIAARAVARMEPGEEWADETEHDAEYRHDCFDTAWEVITALLGDTP